MKILNFLRFLTARYLRQDALADTRMREQKLDHPSVTKMHPGNVQPKAPCMASSSSLPQHQRRASSEPCTPARPTSVTSLERALTTLGERQVANPSEESQKRLQLAFSAVNTYLERYDTVQQPLTFMPLLILIARRLSHLGNSRQAAQGLSLVGRTLHAFPDLALAHALATQLTGLPEELQQRTLTILEDVLAQTGNLPQAHVDILVELTGAMHCPGCRERIDTLIQTALTQLRLEPVLSGEIRLAMIKGFSHNDGEMTLMA